MLSSIINKITEKSYNEYYKNIYMEIFEKCDTNDTILIINQNYYNPLNHFSHFIKKYNLKIFIFFRTSIIKQKFINETKGEELIDHIYCDFNNIEELNKLHNFTKFSNIIIFHIKKESYSDKLLELVNPITNEFSKIYIYVSLSNKKSKIQNTIRNLINKNTSYEVGNILNNDTFFNTLNSNKSYLIDAIKIYKDNHYAIYGENTIYEIILIKKN
jgi:hypothetical protein